MSPVDMTKHSRCIGNYCTRTSTFLNMVYVCVILERWIKMDQHRFGVTYRDTNMLKRIVVTNASIRSKGTISCL